MVEMKDTHVVPSIKALPIFRISKMVMIGTELQTESKISYDFFQNGYKQCIGGEVQCSLVLTRIPKDKNLRFLYTP